jgi:hypothetical protein
MVEDDPEAFLQLRLVISLEFRLGRWETWPDRVVNEVQFQPAVLMAIAERVQQVQSGDALLVRAAATLLIDVLLEITWQRGGNDHAVARKELRQVALSVFEQHRQITAVDHGTPELAGGADEVAELRVDLRGATGDINGLQLRVIPQDVDGNTRGLCGHCFSTLRTGIDVTVLASLIAGFPYIQLQCRNFVGAEFMDTIAPQSLTK